MPTYPVCAIRIAVLAIATAACRLFAYGLVDERIAGHRPMSVSAAEAAALPLTCITAWELLFDRLGVEEGDNSGQSLLVIGAGGGAVDLVQLSSKLTGLTVVGTASRPATQAWVRELGAHHFIDHSNPLQPQLAEAGIQQIDHVASLSHTDTYYAQIVELLKPEGQLALIDDPAIAGRDAAQAQVYFVALGVHVHLFDVPHGRHDQTARVAQSRRSSASAC